jgi:hypothetical protein
MMKRPLSHPCADSNSRKPTNPDTELVTFAECAIFRLSKAFPSNRARQKIADGPPSHVRNSFFGFAVWRVISLPLRRFLGSEKIRKSQWDSSGNSMSVILRIFRQLVKRKRWEIAKAKSEKSKDAHSSEP